MNFFDRQEAANRQTRKLVVLFGVSVVLTILCIYLALVAIFMGRDTVSMTTARGAVEVPAPEFTWWHPELFFWTVFLTSAVVAYGTLYKLGELRGGGPYIARMLGGQRVRPDTTDLGERRLLNIVEEMSIASGLPVPQVYVLRAQRGINAFAAGYDVNDAVVAVTDGAMHQLTRDELQGVVAHEFAHILSGDMRTNVRLIGYIGLFFGSLIKAALSRQREFHADATAVNLTRNPRGIAGALLKIGGFPTGSMIDSSNVAEASHMYFGDGRNINHYWLPSLATHPPLEQRIRAIVPTFSGRIPKQQPSANPIWAEELGISAITSPTVRPAGPTVGVAAGMVRRSAGLGASEPWRRRLDSAQRPLRTPARTMVEQVGTPGPEQLAFAHDLIAALPEPLHEALHRPHEAPAVIFALLLDTQERLRTQQLALIDTVTHDLGVGMREVTERLAPMIAELGLPARLPLIDLSLPALKQLTVPQRRIVHDTVGALVMLDGTIDLFEFVLTQVLRRHLRTDAPTRRPVAFHSIAGLSRDLIQLLTALPRVGNPDPAMAQAAFIAAMRELNLGADRLPTLHDTTQTILAQALDRIDQAAPRIKQRVILACATCVLHDGFVSAREAELLRAIADGIGCPTPPLVAPAATPSA